MMKIRGKEISMIFQTPGTSLNPVFRVKDQIIETILQHQQMSKEEALNESIKLIESMGIPSPSERIKNYPHEFSTGMQQRIMIAIALSCNPSLLIADEPTTALDVTIQAQIIDLLINLKKKYDTSILYITHNLGVVAEICDKVAVMYAGQIVEFANVKTIFKNPVHPYTLGLMRALPKPDNVGKLLEIPGVVPSLINLPMGCSFCPRCDRAQEICKNQKPSMIEVEPGHFITCHLASK
jgi:oligopeptide/dipeptide ABC transporter ATP-binding protein